MHLAISAGSPIPSATRQFPQKVINFITSFRSFKPDALNPTQGPPLPTRLKHNRGTAAEHVLSYSLLSRFHSVHDTKLILIKESPWRLIWVSNVAIIIILLKKQR